MLIKREGSTKVALPTIFWIVRVDESGVDYQYELNINSNICRLVQLKSSKGFTFKRRQVPGSGGKNLATQDAAGRGAPNASQSRFLGLPGFQYTE